MCLDVPGIALGLMSCCGDVLCIASISTFALEQVCSESRLAYLLAAGKLGWVSRLGLPLEWPQMDFYSACRQACRHIFHLECAQQLATRKCPVCLRLSGLSGRVIISDLSDGMVAHGWRRMAQGLGR